MENQSLEEIVASNLQELRKSKKWTQAELAEKINYSDKSVSKWERGEGLPDLKVMKQLADLFGVTLDFFVTENAARELEKYEMPKNERGYRIGIMLLAVSIVWLVASAVYMYAAIYAKVNLWISFIWAIPVSAFVVASLSQHWKFRVCAVVFRSILCWTLITAVYLQMLQYNMWMIFLIGIPAQVTIVLWALIRHKFQR